MASCLRGAYSILSYRLFLICVSQAIGTRVLQRTTHLLDSAKDVHITQDMFAKSILPIGALFSGSLILSNKAYLYLSVHYIQMLKAFNPVAILLITWAFRIQEPNKKLGVIVVMISSGVALASRGELHFDLTGFLIQAAAVAFEASRLVMIQILLHGLKMDPLVSLHYYAPVSPPRPSSLHQDTPDREGRSPSPDFPIHLLHNEFNIDSLSPLSAFRSAQF